MNVRLKASVNMKDDIYAKIKIRSFLLGQSFIFLSYTIITKKEVYDYEGQLFR